MLYGHSQDLTAAMPFIRRTRPAYWKVIDPDEASARECAELGVKLIVRHWGAWDQNADAFLDGEYLGGVSREPWFPFAWGIETPNEPYPGQDVPVAYIEREASFVEWCRAWGKEAVVCNRGTGHDGHFVPGATHFGIHEYGWPFIGSQYPWHALRFHAWFTKEVLARNPDAKLFVTECGSTQAVLGGQDVGFRTDPDHDAAEHWEHLQEYDRLAKISPGYLGAFVYQLGGFADWQTFEVLGTAIEDLLAAHLQASGTMTSDSRHEIDEDQEDGMAEFVLGFKDVADTLGAGVVGEPQADERSLKDVDGNVILAVQPTTKGIMIYVPGGQPGFYPKA